MKDFLSGKSDIPPRLPPEREVIRSHAAVTDISIQTAQKFDKWELWDNNVPMGAPRIKIATCEKGGRIKAEKGQENRLQAFLDKGNMRARVEDGYVVF